MLHAFRSHSSKLAFAAAGAALLSTHNPIKRYLTKSNVGIVKCDSNATEEHPALMEVELNNGTKVPRAIVGASMLSFSALMEKNPIALYELVQKCKDEKHQLWMGTESDLKDLHLLGANGRTNRSVCDVLLSAITGDGLDLSLGSPYPKQKAKL